MSGAPARGFPPVDPILAKGVAVLAQTQAPQGSWKGDYGGPLFLLPVYVAGIHLMGAPLDAKTRDGFVRYLRKHQNTDGGYGLDVEAPSCVFASVLNYVALRLLGLPAEDVGLLRARAWFLPHGGPLGSGSWGKFILALLGLYAYEGLHPVPPELWLLPTALPFHPSRLWCHCRMVYLPMGWLYGKRIRAEETPTLEALRAELYTEPFGQVNWGAAKDRVAATDAYAPRTGLLRLANRALGIYERLHSRKLRARALDESLAQIRGEDEATHHIDIGPINKVLNAVVMHFAEPGGASARLHLSRLQDYLQEDAEGVRVNGYNSSELWDTAFAVQALCDIDSPQQTRATLLEAARFIEANQVLEDSPDAQRFYRHQSRGGWPFSTRDHGWPISDCTGEGLKASLLLEERGLNLVPVERLAQAVALILSLQNKDGGWATYELQRGPRWLERLNPSDIFSTIMVDVSYVECSSSCITALAAWRSAGHGGAVEDRAIATGAQFIRRAQGADGAWEGSWGVCFSYGTWFGVNGLLAAGANPEDSAVRRAVAFLKAKQRPDGAWSETVESCRRREWVEGGSGHAVTTSWALLALAAAGESGAGWVQKGAAWLRDRQGADGRWPPEPLAGVFNKTCAIHYDCYLRIFPLWALSKVGAPLESSHAS